MYNSKVARLSGPLLVFLTCLVVLSAATVSAQDVKPEIQSALSSGDTAKAVELLQQQTVEDKTYHMNYYLLGRIAFNRGELEKAKKNFAEALDRKSKHYESMYYLGRTYLELGLVDSAQILMEEGRKKVREKHLKGMFENGYGLVMMAAKDFAEADKAFRQALVSDSTNAEYHINLGDANFGQGVPSLAASSYESALKLDTASGEVYYHWAEACLEMKDYQCAIEKLRIVLQKDSTHAGAWMRAGGIFFKAAQSSKTREDRGARFKETIGAYKKYLELSGAKPDSASVRAYFELAMAYSNLAGYEDAVGYFEQVLAIPYEPRDIYFHYGKALWGIKQYDRATEMLQKHQQWVSQQGPTYQSNIGEDEFYQLLGDTYFYRNPRDYANAITYYQKSLDLNANQKRLLQNTGIAYQFMKSYAQALGYYEKRIALGIDSTSADVYKNAGSCAYILAGSKATGDDLGLDDEEGDTAGMGAVQQAAAATAVNTNRNYYEVAVEYFSKFLEYQPKDLKVLNLVGSIYLGQMKDCQKGLAAYERLLQVDPGNCVARKSLGVAYLVEICTKNYSRALGYFNDAYACLAKSGGGCGDVELMLYIAQCYHLRAAEKGAEKAQSTSDFKNANDWYNKVLKCEPGNSVAKKGRDDTQFEF